MLTESVSDPRRANWLTISSMSEDLCWPEENNNSRPSWELEAEILRLTTRLMMREQELKQVKSQLKTQVTKSQQQLSTWRRKIEEKEEQVRELLRQKDSEMQGIVSQLLLFESELRKEQSRIESLLQEKDAQILTQQKELEQLRGMVDAQVTSLVKSSSEICRKGSSSSFEDDTPYKTTRRQIFTDDDSSATDSQEAVQKLRDGLLKIRGIQDVTNVKKSMDLFFDPIGSEKKRVTYRTPQKMKDLKAKRERINSHNKLHRPVISEISAQAIL